MKKTIACAMISLTIGSGAMAQSESVTRLIEDVIDKCADGSTALELKKLAETWGMTQAHVPLLSSERAVACYEAFIGEDIAFVNGNYVRVAYIGKETSIQRQRRLEQEAADREARKAENIEIVNGKVYTACVALVNRDHIAAYTNELCVNSFKANGDPS